VARPTPATSDAPGAAAASSPPLGLDLPTELHSLGAKDVADLLEGLNSGLLLPRGGAGGGDQQQQQDQNRQAGHGRVSEQGGGELGECNAR